MTQNAARRSTIDLGRAVAFCEQEPNSCARHLALAPRGACRRREQRELAWHAGTDGLRSRLSRRLTGVVLAVSESSRQERRSASLCVLRPARHGLAWSRPSPGGAGWACLDFVSPPARRSEPVPVGARPSSRGSECSRRESSAAACARSARNRSRSLSLTYDIGDLFFGKTRPAPFRLAGYLPAASEAAVSSRVGIPFGYRPCDLPA